MPKNTSTIIVVAIIFLLIGAGVGYLIAAGLSHPALGTVDNLDRPNPIPQVSGWDDDEAVQYWDFGPNPNVAIPILVFFQADSPDTPVSGQNNIIDSIPGQPGYSDFWRVHKVLAPSGYTPNSIKSFEAAVNSGYTIEITDIVVNCPVVNPDTTLEGSDQDLVQGWYRDMKVFYFDFGTRSPNDGSIVLRAPIWVFFLEDGTAVEGQNNVIDLLPDEEGYSDLWHVHKVVVDSSYVANSYKSAADIMEAAGSGGVTVEETTIFVNCPV
jgi:hypothetical protein